jgi:hypothetical protein
LRTVSNWEPGIATAFRGTEREDRCQPASHFILLFRATGQLMIVTS